MKSFFIHIFKHTAVTAALVMLVVAPFQPLIAQAQVADSGAVDQQLTNQSNAVVAQTQATLSPGSGAIQNQPNPAPAASTGTSDIGCSVFTGTGIALCLSSVIYIFTVGIGTGFAYTAAMFFDFATQLTLNGAAYALTFISTGWTTARDIANMAFLFILLYIAFKIMFEAETNGTIHTLVLVIVIALLVNFSFFFTRLAIDAGNILAVQFYNAIQAPSIGTTIGSGSSVSSGVATTINTAATVAGVSNWANTKDLTASIMSMLQLQNLYSTQSFTTFINNQSGASGFAVTFIATTFIYIAAGIMLWLLTVAFAANGVKFLMRTVVLWFLIIASPIAFVCRAVPKFEGYYDKWQEALIKHSIYPAVFIFIFLMLTNFSNQMALGSQSLIGDIFGSIPQGATSGSSVAGIGIAVANIAIRLGFVVAVLYIGLKAAEEIGVMGAKQANNFGSWLGGQYVGATSGAAGALGRNTFGLAGNRLANSNQVRSGAAQAGAMGLVWRGVRGAAGTVGSASFDARGLPGASVLGKEAGKAQKGGYASAFDARVKTKEKKGKDLEPGDGQKERALAKAKTESGYTEPEKIFNSSKESASALDARIKTLIATGKDGSEEMRNAQATKVLHEAQMNVAKRKMDSFVEKRSKEISGEGASKVYADTLSTPNLRNLGFPFTSSKDAAAKIRKGKTDVEKIADAVTKAAKDDKEKDAPKKDDH